MLDCCFYSNLYCKGPIKIILRPPTISIPHSHDFPFVHSKICPWKYNNIKINGSHIFLLGFNTIYWSGLFGSSRGFNAPYQPLPARTAAPRRPTIPVSKHGTSYIQNQISETTQKPNTRLPCLRCSVITPSFLRSSPIQGLAAILPWAAVATTAATVPAGRAVPLPGVVRDADGEKRKS